ncbi:hypothetical protein B0H12DRAFT_1070530 [Mycena haematopus]|nr:hypothetical protein B0H12DRAFT_1070530 [Mycena haematopus]
MTVELKSSRVPEAPNGSPHPPWNDAPALRDAPALCDVTKTLPDPCCGKRVVTGVSFSMLSLRAELTRPQAPATPAVRTALLHILRVGSAEVGFPRHPKMKLGRGPAGREPERRGAVGGDDEMGRGRGRMTRSLVARRVDAYLDVYDKKPWPAAVGGVGYRAVYVDERTRG